MSEERRYTDLEVREILDLAIHRSERDLPALAPSDGLTMSQLRDVAAEVGLSSDRVAEAVAEFEGRSEVQPRKVTMGLPTAVGRSIPLARAPTDHEWELLVAEMRSTFGRKGEVTSQGSMREWSDGTLHAFVEPTEQGHRLRMVDSNEAALGGAAIGGFMLAFALLIFVVLLGKDDPGFRFAVPAFFSVIGAVAIGGTRAVLPAWASEREDQMARIAARTRVLIEGPPADGE